MKKLIIPSLFALLPMSSFAQAPDTAEQDAAPEERPLMESSIGRGILSKDFLHRKDMADDARTLERRKIKVQIAEEEAKLAKLKAEAELPMVPMMPADGMPRGGMVTRAGPATSAPRNDTPPPAPVPTPVPRPDLPRAVGLVGSTGMFRLGDRAMAASTGQVIGAWMVKSIEDRSVTLQQLSDPSYVVTLRIP